ncbi:hypothetical protein D5125_11830 [Magnetovirga frankeli]|uniref:hypothetical protein n=1 Tax=Magnetovirga frankeli TaxID=947516 RepID=UPI0012933F9F|nr:hypothetical protein D5125_11830 [gamma proteobacterium SS-5]
MRNPISFSSPYPKAQQGMASLLTALALMITLTIITFFTAKIVLNDTRVSANHYRTTQAIQAAQAALDHGLAYFKGVVDTDGDGIADGDADFVGANTFTIPAANQQPTETNCTMPTAANTPAGRVILPDTLGMFWFNFNTTAGEPCSDTNGLQAELVTRGWSDDCTAQRTISVCVGYGSFGLGGGSPKQPFITRGSVGAFGNAMIINRFNNSSIWAGGSASQVGNAFETYLRPSNTLVGDYTNAQLIDADESQNTQEVSNGDAGFGIDVVYGDPTLANKTTDEFFAMFFNSTKDDVKGVAELLDQVYSDGASLDGEKGYVWVEGDATVNATTTVGSLDNPVVLVIDGDLTLNGGAEIYGIVYVTGELKMTGTPAIYGSVIAEDQSTGGVGGTVDLIYVPYGSHGFADPSAKGGGTTIPGTWRDW